MTPLQQFTADHKFLLAAVTKQTGMEDPIGLDLDVFYFPLTKHSVRGPVLPVDDVLIRDWDPTFRQYWPGVKFGIRRYKVRDVEYVRVFASCDTNKAADAYDFFAVARKDYARFYRIALECRDGDYAVEPPPVLAAATQAALRRNTIDYLQRENLDRIKKYGGRPKRGLLLSGPPGNGKTSACRWVRQQCEASGLEHRVVSPDDYRAARASPCAPAEAVKQLFRVQTAGVVFFDDLDMALRDRARSENPEDQAVFLGALDGIEVNAGAAYVFTTNLSPALIDPAFKRPGRIDAILHLPKPDAALRRELVGRWHADIRAAVDPERVVADTEDRSFAEVEELKNLLILRFTEVEAWDWEWAKAQFAEQRNELANDRPRAGFMAALNGSVN